MPASSECFGDTMGIAADEKTPFRPRSPYAVAKAAAFWQSAAIREAYDLHACSGNPVQSRVTLAAGALRHAEVVAAAARIAAGSRERLGWETWPSERRLGLGGPSTSMPVAHGAAGRAVGLCDLYRRDSALSALRRRGLRGIPGCRRRTTVEGKTRRCFVRAIFAAASVRRPGARAAGLDRAVSHARRRARHGQAPCARRSSTLIVVSVSRSARPRGRGSPARTACAPDPRQRDDVRRMSRGPRRQSQRGHQSAGDDALARDLARGVAKPGVRPGSRTPVGAIFGDGRGSSVFSTSRSSALLRRSPGLGARRQRQPRTRPDGDPVTGRAPRGCAPSDLVGLHEQVVSSIV